MRDDLPNRDWLDRLALAVILTIAVLAVVGAIMFVHAAGGVRPE